ncbi:MAG TPA: hypothetical protein PLG79_00970 [Spirochaetales bacterium]|nr:hypothetical protein [Spirochaetales bacterium]
MKHQTLWFLLFILFAGSIFAEVSFDYGGEVRTLIGWEDPGDGFLLEGEPAVWVVGDLSSHISLEARLRILSTLDRSFLFDLERGVVSVKLPQYPTLDSQFLFKGGRIVLSDFSGFILDHRLDGAYAQWEFPFTRIELGGGFTGWLPRETADIKLSLSDALDEDDEDVQYAPPRLVEVATLTVPALLFSQDIILSIVLQQDLRQNEPERPPARSDRVYTYYTGLGSTGYWARELYCSVFGYLEWGTVGQDTRLFSGIYGISAAWKPQGEQKGKGEFRLVSSSGDDRISSFYSSSEVKESNLFLPVSLQKTGIAFSPIVSNITFLEVRYGFSPLARVWTEAGMFFFFRTTGGPISESGLDTEDRADRFLGPELDLQTEWQIYSDLRIQAGLGLFIPASGRYGAFADHAPYSKGTLEVCVSF